MTAGTGFAFSGGAISALGGDCLSSQFELATGYNGAAWNCRCASFPSVKAWHHYVAIYDTSQTPAANEIKLYIDGVSQTLSATVWGNDLTNNWANTSFNIGNRYNTTYSAHAIIDEVRVYSRVLTQSEITDLYRLGAAKLKFSE